MTAVNHSVFGALTVAVIGNPVIGLPLAIASHFLLDSLPHFGAHTVAEAKSRDFRSILLFDTFLTACFTILVTFASIRAGWSWWWLPLGAFLGWVPDLMWYKHYQNDLKGEEKEWDFIRRFHKKIQRWELSWGWTVEVVWFTVTVALLSYLIFR